MEKSFRQAVHVNDRDNCVTLSEPAKAGDSIRYADSTGASFTVTALSDIPKWHKAAIRDIPEGGEVIKYGERIGNALCDIRTGDYVHCHNVK